MHGAYNDRVTVLHLEECCGCFGTNDAYQAVKYDDIYYCTALDLAHVCRLIFKMFLHIKFISLILMIIMLYEIASTGITDWAFATGLSSS